MLDVARMPTMSIAKGCGTDEKKPKCLHLAALLRFVPNLTYSP